MKLEERVRIIPHRIGSAAFNLAIDRALLKNMEYQLSKSKSPDPIVRTYQFSRPSVIMGYDQKIDGRYDENLARQLGVDLTVRDTGGGHLYTSINDIHFSFIVPPHMFPKNKITDVYENYANVNSIVAEALRKAGYNAILGRTSIRLNSNDGRIISGTARRSAKNSFLHQGVILIDPYTPKIFRLLMASKDEIKLWRERVSSLGNLSGNYSNIPKLISDSFPKRYIKDLTKEESEEAQKIHDEVYSNPKVIYAGKKEGKVCLVAGESSTKDKEQENSL